MRRDATYAADAGRRDMTRHDATASSAGRRSATDDRVSESPSRGQMPFKRDPVGKDRRAPARADFHVDPLSAKEMIREPPVASEKNRAARDGTEP